MKPQNDRGVSENALSMGNTADGGKGALEDSHADPAMVTEWGMHHQVAKG